MRALLIETSPEKERFFGRSRALIDFFGKPMVVHTIEWLVRHGVTDIKLVLHGQAAELEEVIGDGERWGITIEYFLVREAELPFSTVAWSLQEGEGALFVGRGDCFPANSVATNNKVSTLWVRQKEWQGWALVSQEALPQVQPGWQLNDLYQALASLDESVEEGDLISARTEALLLNSIERVGECPDSILLPTGIREIHPKIWADTTALIDPGVRFRAPAFVGRGVHLAEGAVIGPDVALEEGVIVDEFTEVTSSHIFPRTYLGQRLQLERTLVDRERLVHTEHGTTLEVNDAMIIAPLAKASDQKELGRGLELLLAAVLLLPLAPFALLGVVSSTPKSRRVVCLPSSTNHKEWEERLWIDWFYENSSLPNYFRKVVDFSLSLLQVLIGEARMVGMPPRERVEVEALSEQWRSRYLSSKIGVFTQADGDGLSSAKGEELLPSEMYYAAHEDRWYDIKLFAQVGSRVLLGKVSDSYR